MAASAHVYTHAADALSSAAVNWLTDDIRVALLGSDYTPDQDGHVAWGDISSHEVAAAAGVYTAGGFALTGKSKSYPSGTHNQALNGAAIVFTAPINAAYIVVYDNTPTGKPLLAYISLGGTAALTGVNWTGAILTLAGT